MDKAILGFSGPGAHVRAQGLELGDWCLGLGRGRGGGGGVRVGSVGKLFALSAIRNPKSVNPAFFSTFLYGTYMMTDSCRPYLWPKRPTFVRNYTERNYNEEGLFGNRVSKPPNKANVKTPVPMASRHGECRKGTFNPT